MTQDKINLIQSFEEDGYDSYAITTGWPLIAPSVAMEMSSAAVS